MLAACKLKMTDTTTLKNGFRDEPHHEVHFDLTLDDDSDEKNPLINIRRKSKEIRRPSITLSREFSTTSTGEEFIILRTKLAKPRQRWIKRNANAKLFCLEAEC